MSAKATTTTPGEAKRRIRELRGLLGEALAQGDQKRARRIRRSVHQLKRESRRIAAELKKQVATAGEGSAPAAESAGEATGETSPES